jgi:hypothetical protein
MRVGRRREHAHRLRSDRLKRCTLFASVFLLCVLLSTAWGWRSGTLGQQPPSEPTLPVPERDVRLAPDLAAELTAYKKDFRLPDWATQGRARQVRFDGGPMFAACQLESGWKYLTDPQTPGFVGIIKSIWTLTNLYTDDIERRLDDIRAAGYNWVWVSYQLGYAFDDEARQRAQVRRLIQLAHARGIHVTAYFSLTSIFTNSAFIGNPESKSWVQENADGTPVAYSGIPTRLMACVNKPGRLDYLKKIVRLAVEDGADDIFWDSIFNRCYCSYCERGFREYSKRVLGRACPIPRKAADKQKKQFGIEENYDFDGLTDTAVTGLYAEYGHYAVAKAIAELDRYAKSINPNVLVSINTHRFRYVDDVADVTWSEDSNQRGGRIDENGKLTTPIGLYAWFQSVAQGRKPIELTVAPHEYWQVQSPAYYKQTIAEAASFQANFVMLASYAFATRFDDGDPIARQAWMGISDGLRFIESHQQLFENSHSVADVALYYSYPSRLRPDAGRQETPDWQAVTQNFMLAGIPARVITDENAARMGAKGLLDQAKMLVLVGASSLSNEEVALLKQYTSLGGKLLLAPDAGAYTSFGTRRPVAPWEKDSPGVKIATAGELTSPRSLAVVTQALLNREPLISIQGNGYQIANPVGNGNRLLFHIVNYDRSREFENLHMSLTPGGYPETIGKLLGHHSKVRWLTPDEHTQQDVAITWQGQKALVTIPRLNVSGILVVSPN